VCTYGRQAGGPAKVACWSPPASSPSVSGSAVAKRDARPATFSIPLMNAWGQTASRARLKAGGLSGGQIMHRQWGLRPFVMAEYLGVGYLTVAEICAGPGDPVLMFPFWQAVHFEAKRNGHRLLSPKEDQFAKKRVLLERGHLFLPLVIIVGVLMMGTRPYAALCGIKSRSCRFAALRKTNGITHRGQHP